MPETMLGRSSAPTAAAYDAKKEHERRRDKMIRLGQLETIRSSWFHHWQDISTHLLPRNGRFFTSDRNRGEKRHNRILDNTGTRALRVLGAGMMAGATSPARPWFRLAAADPDLNEFHPVKLWVEDVVQRMLRVFSRSNTYRALHQVYEEMAAFGTGCSIMLPDFENVIHHYPLTIGEYMLAQDYKGRVSVMYREFEKSVAELVAEFGLENCSSAVRSSYHSGQLESTVKVIHAIEPRKDRVPGFEDSRQMQWSSVYFESGSEDTGFLREGGFEMFPVLAPRWAVSGGDVYGHGPGMESLGDIRQIQHQQIRKAEAIDLQTKPPLQVPTSFKEREVETMSGGRRFDEPGGLFPYDQVNQNGGIRTAYEVNLRLDWLLQDIQDVRERIRSSFFADLFLMLATAGPHTRMTATEVAERHEEKLLMLGPVLERLHDELLRPMIDMTFAYMLRAGALPPPPPDLLGQDLGVEFISILAQAQQAIGVNAVDRYVSSLLSVAQGKADVLDTFNADEWSRIYASRLGVDSRMIVPEDSVSELRRARAEALAAKERADLAKQQAKTPSVMTDIMDQFSGYGGQV
jgi:hypothetical protein